MCDQELSITVVKPQLNYILVKLKVKPDVAQALMTDKELLAEWTKLAVTLNVLGPAYDADIWMTYWCQLVASVQEKYDRIATKQSRAKLSEVDIDVLNVYNASEADLISLKTSTKNKPLASVNIQSASNNNSMTPPRSSATSNRTAPSRIVPSSNVLAASNNNRSSISASQGAIPKSLGMQQKSSVPATSRNLAPLDPGPSTSTGHFTVPAHRSSLSGDKSGKALQQRSIEAINDGNEMIATLAKHLESCFKEHTDLLERSFRKLNTTLDKLINKIITTFLNQREENDGQDNYEVPQNQANEEAPEDMQEDIHENDDVDDNEEEVIPAESLDDE